MRRIRATAVLACGAVVAALALAAGAASDLRTYTGGFDAGGTVGFRAKVDGRGDVRQVDDFHWRRLQAACDEGDILLRGRLEFPIPVNDRGRWSAVGVGGGDQARIEGEFTNGRRRAHRFLRVQGTFQTDEGLYRNCDTRRARWRASR